MLDFDISNIFLESRRIAWSVDGMALKTTSAMRSEIPMVGIGHPTNRTHSRRGGEVEMPVKIFDHLLTNAGLIGSELPQPLQGRHGDESKIRRDCPDGVCVKACVKNF
jgi:hypothetical protein